MTTTPPSPPEGPPTREQAAEIAAEAMAGVVAHRAIAAHDQAMEALQVAFKSSFERSRRLA